MDELDILKKDWKRRESNYPKLSYNEIYKMILKKSSSIVKWIFIISLLEFVFWISISFLLKGTSYLSKVEELGVDHILMPISIVSYFVLIYFFYLFYKNYKNISATDNSKVLMENILKTRRSVKYYVMYNLFSLIVGVFIGIFYVITYDQNFAHILNQASTNGNLPKVYLGFIIGIIIVLIISIAILMLFYWIVYGRLLKRLNKNYKELKKLED